MLPGETKLFLHSFLTWSLQVTAILIGIYIVEPKRWFLMASFKTDYSKIYTYSSLLQTIVGKWINQNCLFRLFEELINNKLLPQNHNKKYYRDNSDYASLKRKTYQLEKEKFSISTSITGSAFGKNDLNSTNGPNWWYIKFLLITNLSFSPSNSSINILLKIHEKPSN